MLEHTRRSFSCAVAAVDLVGYSTLNVSEQLRLRDVFTASLLEAIDHVPPNQRIIVDTGGGAMVSSWTILRTRCSWSFFCMKPCKVRTREKASKERYVRT